MPRKQNRRARRRYEPSVTPTHFIRLSRLRITVDPTLCWYAVRLVSHKEREIDRHLRGDGFTTCRAVEVDLTRAAGGVRETERRPLAGYLFVGFPGGMDGRSALWGYHDRLMAKRPSVSLPDGNGGFVEVQPRSVQDRPFIRVIGPFSAVGLQRFVDRLKPPPVAVLWSGEGPVFTFPARAAGIVDGEEVRLAEPVAA